MKNFDHHIETEILFGEGKIKGFGKKIAAVTDSVLLCYGGGSIKKNGVYDAAVAELREPTAPAAPKSGRQIRLRLRAPPGGTRDTCTRPPHRSCEIAPKTPETAP